MTDHYPSEIAQAYDELAFMWRLYVPVVSSIIVGRRWPNVLDLGCGTGSLLIELSASIDSGLGIDIAPAMIAIAREKARVAAAANLTFDVGDFLLVPFERQFDLVVCIDGVLPSLPGTTELSAFFWRLSAILSTGGSAVVEFWTPAANPQPRIYITELPTALRHPPRELAYRPFMCAIDKTPLPGQLRYTFFLPDTHYSYVILKTPEREIAYRHYFYSPAVAKQLITDAGLSIVKEIGLSRQNEILALDVYSPDSPIWTAVVSR
jgi:SAM-dependent methyltransferase